MASNQRFYWRISWVSLGTWLTRASADPDASAAAILGCTYLLLVSLTDIFGYAVPPQTLPVAVASSARALLMLLLLVLLLAGRHLGSRLCRPHRWMFVVIAVLAAFESARSIASPYHTHSIASAIIACLALTFAVDFPARMQGSTGKSARWFCVVVFLAVCLVHASVKPIVFDVADTSISAIKAMLMGLNPYKVDLDQFDERFTGYKYSPLLPIIYLPFVTLFGNIGILICNSITIFLTALAVAALCQRIFGGNGVWAAMLFLVSPLVVMNVLVYRINDLLAVLPICVAFLVWNRRPGLAGLLLGASASTKILPAPIAMALLLPRGLPTARRFVVGIAVGLIPVIAFAALDPAAFFKNVVLFEIVRSSFPSSWLLHMPSSVIWLLRIGFVATFLATAAAALIRDWSIDRRMMAYVVLTIILLLTSQINQDNYWLWWIPLFPPLLSARWVVRPFTASETQ
jgi:Glycosyltransferase family 87